jgi:hypothetical protein
MQLLVGLAPEIGLVTNVLHADGPRGDGYEMSNGRQEPVSVSAAKLVPVGSRPTPGEHLTDQRYVVLLLRLLVDRDGRIVHGDAGGTDKYDSGMQRWVHFHGPDGLAGAVQAWLEEGPESRDTLEQ